MGAKNATPLGEYCVPCVDGEETHDKNGGRNKNGGNAKDGGHNKNGGFRGESCMLYESGGELIGSSAAYLGEYSEPYERVKHEEHGDELYSEPL